MWERFQNASEAEIPSDERELLDILAGALALAKEEWAGAIDVTIERRELNDEVPVIDLDLRQTNGLTAQARVFLCNRPTQGGGLKRQLDKVLAAMNGKPCFMLRASDFPANPKSSRKNQTAEALRKFREAHGRQFLVPIVEWEHMMMVREFYNHHRSDPGFATWFANAKLLSKLAPMIPLLRLDLLGFGPPKPAAPETANGKTRANGALAAYQPPQPGVAAPALPNGGFDQSTLEEDELPLSVILDENGANGSSIIAGRELASAAKPVRLNKNVLKRHAAVLGGSGSGKTTLALCLIEQLLLQGIPAVLIDRKGDLCSYANPDVWRENDEENCERSGEREKLADAIDVAVFTPGRASGRPISITLLPNGINELPDHEQQLLANLSAAALGEMLHLKNSATHQKQSGTLSVALRILGSRHSREVTLSDLIHLLEDEDPELSDLTQRMDPSGKIRRDLVAQLELTQAPQLGAVRGGRRIAAHGIAARPRALRPRGAHAAVDHLHGLPRRQREHPVLGVAVPVGGPALLPAQPQRRIAGRRHVRRGRPLHSRQRQAGDRRAAAEPVEARPLSRARHDARHAIAGRPRLQEPRSDHELVHRPRARGHRTAQVESSLPERVGLEPAAVLPGQTVGEFHLVQEGLVRPMKAQRSLILAEQVPFDRIEQLARETKGQDERQLKLFDLR